MEDITNYCKSCANKKIYIIAYNVYSIKDWQYFSFLKQIKTDPRPDRKLSPNLFDFFKNNLKQINRVRNHVQIRSEKYRSICWLWTTHSGLKTRMTCSNHHMERFFSERIWTKFGHGSLSGAYSTILLNLHVTKIHTQPWSPKWQEALGASLDHTLVLLHNLNC